MRASGLYDVVPKNTTVKAERDIVDAMGKGARGLNQRMGYLRRILVGVRPDAWDVVVQQDGKRVPKYMQRELGYKIQQINRERARVLENNYPGFDDMSAREKAKALSNSNLGKLKREDFNVDDLETLDQLTYGLEDRYVQNYLKSLDDANWGATGKDVIADIIAISQVREALTEIFENPFVELQINYIYVASADKTPFEIRKRNVVAFWKEQRRAYVG